MINNFRRTLLCSALLSISFGSMAKEAYPQRTIRLVVPYGTGATTDLMGRLIAQKISEDLKQTVIVDNKGGASGLIGSEFVARSEPDGYTILLATDGTHAGNPFLLKKFPFDAVNDVTPITMGARNLLVLVAHPSLPVKNVKELIEYARKHPGKLSYGSSGNGSPHHLAGVLFNQMAGTDLMHVPYRGGGPAVVDVLGGQVPLIFTSLATVMPHIKSGKLTLLGLTEKSRVKEFPDIPVVAENLPGFEMTSWLAFLGPAKIPKNIVEILNKSIAKALASPDIIAKLNESGLLVKSSSSDEFAKFLKADYDQRGRLITANKISAD